MGELPKNHSKACKNLHMHRHFQQTPTYTYTQIDTCTHTHVHLTSTHTHTWWMCSVNIQLTVPCSNLITEVSSKLCSGDGFQVHKQNQEAVLLAANKPWTNWKSGLSVSLLASDILFSSGWKGRVISPFFMPLKMRVRNLARLADRAFSSPLLRPAPGQQRGWKHWSA